MESNLHAIKAMWIPWLLTTNHIVKEYLDSFCKRPKINIKYVIKTTKTTGENYGIMENFPKQALYVIIYVKKTIR